MEDKELPTGVIAKTFGILTGAAIDTDGNPLSEAFDKDKIPATEPPGTSISMVKTFVNGASNALPYLDI